MSLLCVLYSLLEQRLTLSYNSPLFNTRSNSLPEHRLAVESVILVPALTVKAHYQSIVGPSYSNLSSPQHVTEDQATRQPAQEPLPSLPVKKGVLSLSAVIASLPEDIKLTHSLLEFIEQVARPTLAATVLSSSSSTDSLSSNEAEEAKVTPSPSPISFPVDVTLTFHIQPSTVHLTCQPHSQVECIIQSPDVNFVVSFSLFSHQTMESLPSQDSSSPTTSSITDSSARIVPFNNLYISGCLTTFVLQLISQKENKEALSLTLGQAFIHLSRKSILAQMPPKSRKPATSVDDYETHNKMQVSGKPPNLVASETIAQFCPCSHPQCG